MLVVPNESKYKLQVYDFFRISRMMQWMVTHLILDFGIVLRFRIAERCGQSKHWFRNGIAELYNSFHFLELVHT